MASKWLSSPLARIAFLTGGTVLLTLGINQDENEWIWIGGFLIALPRRGQSRRFPGYLPA